MDTEDDDDGGKDADESFILKLFQEVGGFPSDEATRDAGGDRDLPIDEAVGLVLIVVPMAVITMAADEVATAIFCPIFKKKTKAGTMTTPPPTPQSAATIPLTHPMMTAMRMLLMAPCVADELEKVKLREATLPFAARTDRAWRSKSSYLSRIL